MWALLPLPAALLWIVSSGFGCLRAWFVPGTHAADLSEARDCLIFIVSLSVPLSALLIIMCDGPAHCTQGVQVDHRRARPTAATLLTFFHPFDAAATDLAVHIFAVALVIVANRTFSGRLLATNFSRSSVTRAMAGSTRRDGDEYHHHQTSSGGSSNDPFTVFISLFAGLMSVSFAGVPAAFAQTATKDNMGKTDFMSKDTMSKDSMSKDLQ